MHSSTMALHEINEIPEQWRHSHLAQYNTLVKVKGSTSSWLDLGSSTDEKALEYQTLRATLKDENGAKHLFLAKQAGITNILTVDERTILAKSTDLEERSNINDYSPSQYVQIHLKE